MSVKFRKIRKKRKPNRSITTTLNEKEEKQESEKLTRKVQNKFEKRRRLLKGINASVLTNKDSKRLSNNKKSKNSNNYGMSSSTSKKKRSNKLEDQFTAQSEKPDLLEKQMMEYIESELKKKRQTSNKNIPDGFVTSKPQQPQQTTDFSIMSQLEDLPEHLKITSNLVVEDVDIALNSVQEVKLPIENKLKNIEETEKARKKLQEKMKNNKSDENNTNHYNNNELPSSYHSFNYHKRQYHQELRRKQELYGNDYQNNYYNRYNNNNNNNNRNNNNNNNNRNNYNNNRNNYSNNRNNQNNNNSQNSQKGNNNSKNQQNNNNNYQKKRSNDNLALYRFKRRLARK
ncbi:telomere length and silencing protein 1 tls1 family member [Anaeramoeba flamelloides]|uniref:Telomere length and silencing protein 1 tls1 family member n=1 Tax=Anaeramoeba flamelloides TaxID=1746091 RepID=A0ABQ8XYW3_9EUKA|nr:telomere length and silencing protein 1 tls1 family member [Anaeramoeba flamelloides]